MIARLSIALLVVAAAGKAGAPTPTVASLDAAAEPLRAEFDAAQGKVRAVLLGAPT